MLRSKIKQTVSISFALPRNSADSTNRSASRMGLKSQAEVCWAEIVVASFIVFLNFGALCIMLEECILLIAA